MAVAEREKNAVTLSVDWVALKEQLRRHEAVVLHPYDDANGMPVKAPRGNLTIGIGRNLQSRGITLAEALYLFHNDIVQAAEALEAAFPWVCQLDAVRQQALVNLCFNMGITRLKTFVRMFRALENGEYETAADELLDSRLPAQIGKRADELADMLRKGKSTTAR